MSRFTRRGKDFGWLSSPGLRCYMRRSFLIIAATLIMSAFLAAQHAGSAATSSSSGGSSSSHSGYSGGSSSASHSASHFSSLGSSAHHAPALPRSSPSTAIKSPYVKQDAQPEKASGHSFFHPFRKPQPTEKAAFIHPQTCWRKPCAVCPGGQSSNGRGACVPVSETCLAHPLSLGLYCSTPYWWSNQCRALADELAVEQQSMRGHSYVGESMQYRRLSEQYEDCLRRTGLLNASPYYALYGGLFENP